MKEIFQPSDFQFGELGSPLDGAAEFFNLKDKAAQIANAKLKEKLAGCPVVFGRPGNEFWSRSRQPKDTHTARLAFIEPIEMSKCNHQPYPILKQFGELDFKEVWRCRKCGIELEWKIQGEG